MLFRDTSVLGNVIFKSMRVINTKFKAGITSEGEAGRETGGIFGGILQGREGYCRDIRRDIAPVAYFQIHTYKSHMLH